jgi:hypothetical protein
MKPKAIVEPMFDGPLWDVTSIRILEILADGQARHINQETQMAAAFFVFGEYVLAMRFDGEVPLHYMIGGAWDLTRLSMDILPDGVRQKMKAQFKELVATQFDPDGRGISAPDLDIQITRHQ